MTDLTPYDDRNSLGVPVEQRRNGTGPGEGGFQPEDDTIDLRQLLAILRRRIWLVLGVVAVALLGTAFVVLRQPPVYRANAVVRIQDERQAVAGGIGGAAVEQAFGRSSDMVYTHLQVLGSRSVAARVVDQTGIRLRPVNGAQRSVELKDVSVAEEASEDSITVAFLEEGYRATSSLHGSAEAAYGSPVNLGGVSFTVAARPRVDEARYVVRSRGAMIDFVVRGIIATPRERTNVVDIEFTAGDPHLAQQVVNALVLEFQATSAREAQQQATRRRAFVEAQLAQTDSLLAEAQAALTDFQSREEVYSLEQKFLAQQSGQLTLDIRREELAADLGMLRGLLERLTRGGDMSGLNTLISAPTVAENPLVGQLYNQLVQYETERSSMTSGSWGRSGEHPDVQRLDRLIEETRARLIDAVRSHVEALEARLAALDQLREQNAQALKSLPETGAEEARLRQQVQTIHKMADQLREEYQRARIAEAVEAGQVTIVDLALSPGREISARRGMKITLGLLVGLMAGAGLAFILEQMNTAIRTRDDLERVLGVAGLAVIPHLKVSPAAAGVAKWVPSRLRNLIGSGDSGGRSRRADIGYEGGLITLNGSDIGGSEAYRMLRTNLLFSKAGERLHTLVVTSAVPAEGKTTTSANLAVTFAQQGMRVLLVGCDLRRATVHTLFDVEREPGLTELLVRKAQPREAIKQTAIKGLYVLPAGASPPNPAELLGSRTMRELVEALKTEFELVIFDTPPVLSAADAPVLARYADGTIMVVRAGSTDRNASRQAMHQLEMVGARILGAVLNDPDSVIEGYGDGYYYSYYSTPEPSGA